jgi:hypothetical protein
VWLSCGGVKTDVIPEEEANYTKDLFEIMFKGFKNAFNTKKCHFKKNTHFRKKFKTFLRVQKT